MLESWLFDKESEVVQEKQRFSSQERLWIDKFTKWSVFREEFCHSLNHICPVMFWSDLASCNCSHGIEEWYKQNNGSRKTSIHQIVQISVQSKIFGQLRSVSWRNITIKTPSDSEKCWKKMADTVLCTVLCKQWRLNYATSSEIHP